MNKLTKFAIKYYRRLSDFFNEFYPYILYHILIYSIYGYYVFKTNKPFFHIEDFNLEQKLMQVDYDFSSLNSYNLKQIYF